MIRQMSWEGIYLTFIKLHIEADIYIFENL